MSPEIQSIQSSANPVLKRVRAIGKGQEEGWLLLEGRRLVQDALAAGVAVQGVLVRSDRVHELAELELGRIPVFGVSPAAYEKLGSVKHPPPVMAFAEAPASAHLDDLRGWQDPLVLVVAGLADPGNLGALARSAEAAGARGLVRVGVGVSPWNPRALRGSMGSLLRLPILSLADAAVAKRELDALGFRHRCAATRGGTSPDATDWSGPIALWVSGETGETPHEMRALPGVTIPLAGGVESLNVTVAASLLLFAAGRVRAGEASA